MRGPSKTFGCHKTQIAIEVSVVVTCSQEEVDRYVLIRSSGEPGNAQWEVFIIRQPHDRNWQRNNEEKNLGAYQYTDAPLPYLSSQYVWSRHLFPSEDTKVHTTPPSVRPGYTECVFKTDEAVPGRQYSARYYTLVCFIFSTLLSKEHMS